MSQPATMTPDEAILGYLLHRAALEDGSEGKVVKGAAMHAFVTAKPWTPEAARAASEATKRRVRELLEKVAREENGDLRHTNVAVESDFYGTSGQA